MSAFNFIARIGHFHIETNGEGYRAHNQKDNSITGIFQEVGHVKAYIDRILNPPKCAKCDNILVTESVTGKHRCLTCESFYNEPCRVCRTKRVFCCC